MPVELLVQPVDPIAKALWYIESHFAGEMSLDAIASASGVSRFHLARAFGNATGYSVMQYVRARRLTEAARTLSDGSPDILSVALDTGYESHEGFTHAFRDQFGVTPESVKKLRSLDGLMLINALERDPNVNVTLEEPRIERVGALLIAGISQRIAYKDVPAIPNLWQRFGPHIGHVPGQVDDYAYGVKLNADDESFEYMAGVQVSSLDGLPDELHGARLAEQTYAVFVHRGHIAGIRETLYAIWREYLPQSGLTVVDAPEFERYGSDFNGTTGMGNVEIFIPIQK